MPGRNLSVLLIAMVLSVVCYNRAARNRYAAAIAEAMGDIHENYVEKVDRRELFEGSMRGMVRQLDPYSGFVSSKEYEELLEDLDQEFGGVGIVVDVDPDSERLMVLSPLFGTPAYKAGLRGGDLILEIDGEDTEGLTANDSVDMIRGKPGTDVVLTILPFRSSATREVVLASVPVESVLGDTRLEDGSWEFFLQQHPEIGYVRLTSFGENSAEELRAAIDSIVPGIQSLIFDMRGNPGGLLEAAVDTCSLFLDGGVVVSIKGRGGNLVKEFHASKGTTVPPSLPVVVLVDHYSASASEIVSACLQDYERAKVIGERSWGKGTVQSVIPLEGGRSAMRLTTATYWRPSGRNIHRLQRSEESDEWGVSPDDGFEIKLEQDEYLNLVRSRRNRDVLVTRSGNTLDAESPASADTELETSENDQPGASPPENSAAGGDEAPSVKEADAAAESPEDVDGPFVDRQLEKAIEYLQHLLAGGTAKAA